MQNAKSQAIRLNSHESQCIQNAKIKMQQMIKFSTAQNTSDHTTSNTLSTEDPADHEDQRRTSSTDTEHQTEHSVVLLFTSKVNSN